jgi:anti-sigma B factor antagonist
VEVGPWLAGADLARRVVGPRERAKRIASFNPKETPVPPPDPDLGATDLTGRPLRIDSLRAGDSIVIALSGELDERVAGELDVVLRDAEKATSGQIVVDLSGVSFIDSSGLSALLKAKTQSDGRLSYIPSSHDSVRRLLELTGTVETLRD